MTPPNKVLTTRGSGAFVSAALAHFEHIGPLGSARSAGGFLEMEGRAAYLKYGSLRGKYSVRHALRCLRPGVLVPRLQEFDNLSWLRAHDFGAPLPLAAGVYKQRGLPVFQFLATLRVEGTLTLRELCESSALPGVERPALFTRLGREAARMHSLGFIHGDLFPRNILVSRPGRSNELYFLDAWRAGPSGSLRGATYDLACLMLYATELLHREEQALVLDSYFTQRAELGRQLDRRRFLAAVRRQRSRLVQRLIRRGREHPPIPRKEWVAPG